MNVTKVDTKPLRYEVIRHEPIRDEDGVVVKDEAGRILYEQVIYHVEGAVSEAQAKQVAGDNGKKMGSAVLARQL